MMGAANCMPGPQPSFLDLTAGESRTRRAFIGGGESRKAGALWTGVQRVNDEGRTFHGAALKVTDLQKDSACDLVY